MDKRTNEVEYIRHHMVQGPLNPCVRTSDAMNQQANEPESMHPSTNAAMKRIQGLLRIAGGWWPRWLAAPMAGGPGGLIQKQYNNQSLNQWTN